MRLRLRLAYDGAAFRGWQSQPGGGAVQDVLQQTFARLAGGATVPVQGSGRTDAGVHALGQIAHAEVPDDCGPADWTRALNAVLPPSVRVLSCRRCPASFHARLSATGKVYDYLLWTGPVLPPLRAGRCWHVHPAPDLDLLRAAARVLEGRHDFRGFSANRGGPPVRNTTRHVRSIRVTARGPLVRLRFEGDGFLYKMVRMLVAAIVAVARGKASMDDLRARRDGRPAPLARAVAPAGGLYLVKVTHGRSAQSG
jgi:tRNA pseudouridine38-40 synthase